MTATRTLLENWARSAGLLALLAGIATLVGLLVDAAAFQRAWLLAFVTWSGLPVGALGFRMMHALTGGEWGRAVGGALDALQRTMLLMALLFLPLLWGLPLLYPWARPGFAADPELAHKTALLNAPGFAVRGLAFLVGWELLGFVLYRTRGRLRAAIAALGLIAYAVTVTLAALDWVMSLDPQWISTVFGIRFLIGQTLTALAFAVAVAAFTAARPDTSWRPEPKTLRDLGNLLLAWLVLWTYLEFMQLLIIWNGNLPHGIPWYVARSEGGWLGVSVALALLHFAVPFWLLLFRANKEDPRRLCRIALWLLLMRVLDDSWMVLPAFGAPLHWLDLVVPLAMGGLVLWLVFRLLPTRLPEALALVPEEGR